MQTNAIRLILRDYRCFRREQPAVIDIVDGFTAYVGPNNAGKSSILKALYEHRPLFSMAANLSDSWGSQMESRSGPAMLAPLTDPDEIICNSRNDPQLSVELSLPNPEVDEQSLAIKAVISYSQGSWAIEVVCVPSGKSIGAQHGNRILAHDRHMFLDVENIGRVDLRPLQSAARSLVRTLYVGAFRNAINDGAANYFDLQIGTAFISMWHSWKTGGSKQQNIAMVRVTSQIAHLLGARSLEINASIELKTLQILLDGHPYKLSELGSGIAEMIVVLANAMISRPEIIAIDEPEAHIHPKLQSEFLTTLGSLANTATIFSTHSLGLARSVADYVYSVQKSDRGTVVRELNKTKNYAEFLGSMGLAALQDVGYDTILLVEGTTEVRTFQQFLRLYGIEHRVVVLPLGGSSLINGKVGQELGEVTRMCSRVFAIIDSERGDETASVPKDRREFLAICEKLQITAVATERPATENYFSDRAVKDAVGSSFSALECFAKQSDPPWGKARNWLIARETQREELDGTDIGDFLKKIAL